MHRNLVSLIIVGLALIVFGSSAVLKSKAKSEATVVTQVPGSRCTRLTFGPRQKRSPQKKPQQLQVSQCRARVARASPQVGVRELSYRIHRPKSASLLQRLTSLQTPTRRLTWRRSLVTQTATTFFILILLPAAALLATARRPFGT